VRKLSAIIGVVIFNLALTVFLLELVLRLVPLPVGFRSYLKAVGMIEEQQGANIRDPLTDMMTLRPDQALTWSIMDGKWTMTTVPFPDNPELGFRDDGLNLDTRRKVFAFGDSFTFGFGVNDDEVWHEVLERMYGGEVDIFNLRALGSSVVDTRAMYPLYKDRFPHDVVFLCIYLGNEFMDSHINANLRKKETESEEEIAALPQSDIKQSLYTYVRHCSYTARLIKYLFFRQWIKLGYYNLDTRREVYQPEGYTGGGESLVFPLLGRSL